MLNICVGVGFGVENTGMNMRNMGFWVNFNKGLYNRLFFL